MDKNFRRAIYMIVIVAIAGFALFEFGGLERIGGPPVGTFSPNCAAAIASGYCDSAGTKCQVKVEISDCGVDPVTTPDNLYVCKQNTKITWNLMSSGAASGAKFASNGVNFTNPEFENPKPGFFSFEWMDKHSKTVPERDIKYDLHLLTKDAAFCRNVDPRVSNE